MKPATRAAVLSLMMTVCASAASALTMTLTKSDPIVSIDFPANWDVGEIKRGVEAKSPDRDVYVWFEVFAPAEYDTLVGEHKAYFDKQGVQRTGEARVFSNEESGVRIKFSDFPSTWKGAPTVLRYVAMDFGLPSQKQILMSYWASPAGDKAHDATVRALIDSMKMAR